jgi:hypothetical protein
MPQKEPLIFNHIEKSGKFCREVGKVLQRSRESSAEKSGKFTRVVAQTDASFLRTAQQKSGTPSADDMPLLLYYYIYNMYIAA